MTTEIVTQGDERAEQVRSEITKIKDDLQTNFFTLAELLSEARTNAYHVHYGYPRFGTWVEESSGLDMSERTAYYLCRIVENAKALGIPREQLLAAKMSKLKEVFTLDVVDHGDQIKMLVEKSSTTPLQEIRDEVQQIKVGAGSETFVFMTLKVPKSVKEQIVDPAFELVRRQYGDMRDPKTGDLMDLTDSKCLEFVAVAYTQDPNNEEEPVPVEEAIEI